MSVTQLATKNRISLMLVPGHTNIKGNIIVDELAKQDADTPLTGPEPFFRGSSTSSRENFKTRK